MALNKDQIRKYRILQNYEDKNFTDSTYNLTVGKIIKLENDGVEVVEFVIPPQGMVMVYSKEIFNIPSNTMGYTTMKNALSNKELMAINVGIVQQFPRWKY